MGIFMDWLRMQEDTDKRINCIEFNIFFFYECRLFYGVDSIKAKLREQTVKATTTRQSLKRCKSCGRRGHLLRAMALQHLLQHVQWGAHLENKHHNLFLPNMRDPLAEPNQNPGDKHTRVIQSMGLLWGDKTG